MQRFWHSLPGRGILKWQKWWFPVAKEWRRAWGLTWLGTKNRLVLDPTIAFILAHIYQREKETIRQTDRSAVWEQAEREGEHSSKKKPKRKCSVLNTGQTLGIWTQPQTHPVCIGPFSALLDTKLGCPQEHCVQRNSTIPWSFYAAISHFSSNDPSFHLPIKLLVCLLSIFPLVRPIPWK